MVGMMQVIVLAFMCYYYIILQSQGKGDETKQHEASHQWLEINSRLSCRFSTTTVTSTVTATSTTSTTTSTTSWASKHAGASPRNQWILDQNVCSQMIQKEPLWGDLCRSLIFVDFRDAQVWARQMYILQLCRSVSLNFYISRIRHFQCDLRFEKSPDLLEVEDMFYLHWYVMISMPWFQCAFFGFLWKIWECPESRHDLILYPQVMCFWERVLWMETSIRSSVLCMPSMPSNQAPPLSRPKMI